MIGVVVFGLLVYCYLMWAVFGSFKRREPATGLRKRRSSSAPNLKAAGRMDDHLDSAGAPERSWTALDDIQLIRLLRNAAQ